ncbi:PEP/pyruvate-binding domain-containing protein [Dictyobacter formicarum]|uniref:Phosphoenolpyruvate synthase n=1 Tax=Dictyobacter formicarum TaxID=2778368 RepID=A0ABQ3V9W7_9CHLR|nr:PEP/pyruvate-binding domain-containing protein [Dictyobacter formicarum]GHO82784.1 hypothetical protein KSZ_07900 [Dictyobacter formicarum]
MSVEQTLPFVVALDAASATLEQVGGKGASLARMAAAGLPIPHGFHITTNAYRRFVEVNKLQEKILAVTSIKAEDVSALEAAAQQIGQLFEQGHMPEEIATAIQLAYIELGGDELSVAVRSSATAEDLPGMSFAGQQETYLNIYGQASVLDAVKRCWASLWTARAISYRARYNISSQDVSLAVVVQELVAATAAGVLFTVDPLSGEHNQMMINATWGLGEALVGGLVTPDTIIVEKASGRISKQEVAEKRLMTVRTPQGTHEVPVPQDKRTVPVLTFKQAMELAHIGIEIEKLYDQAMDIEWAFKDGHFFIVQARPITTLSSKNVEFETWNDSLTSNCLWTNANLGEAVPDVMTPCTWSLIQIFMSEATSPMFAKGIKEYMPIGNIGGRFYMNQSLTTTISSIFGAGKKRLMTVVEEVFGHIPDDMEIPLLPASRWKLLKAIMVIAIQLQRRLRTNQKKLAEFLVEAPKHSEELRTRLQNASSAAELVDIWQRDLEPFFRECSSMLEAAARQDGNAMIWISSDLRRLIGNADANILLSGLGIETNQLASLDLLLGLSRLDRGEIDRATFVRLYGHRCPNEFEVSLPRPAEDAAWIDQQLRSLHEAPVNVDALLARQKDLRAAAWERFQQRYPRKAASIQKRLSKAARIFRDRETARSEVVRAFWALRTFVVRAGELTGLDDGLFFLTIDEIIKFLRGNKSVLEHIPTRKATYERYRKLPPYPALICGHFDPVQWASDPQRRSDVFDARHDIHIPTGAVITGFPGAEGIIEGTVRVIANADEGNRLQPGEIMVTIVTNVGWTPLFPRAAAIVTDVGAPLSHAAIVARELGIPAVVGCGNATMRLHTGDRVRVNGTQGTVEILSTEHSSSIE